MRHDVIRAGDPIHPAWCTCSDCTLDRKRGLRLDLVVIGFGASAALAALALLMIVPPIARAVRGLF